MKSRILIAIIAWMTLLPIGLCAQSSNKLIVPDVEVKRGSMVPLAVEMENTDAIVAVQFTLQLPEGVSLNTSQTMKDSRLTTHAISVREVEPRKYIFFVMSANNDAIIGHSGKLFTIDLKADRSLQTGSTLSMTISDAVLSMRTGENVLTEATAGQIIIGEAEKGKLSLQLSPSHVEENMGQQIRLTLTRTNGGVLEETFTLKATADSRISVPATITIPARQPAAMVFLTVTDNDVLDTNSVVEITAEGDDYEAAKAQLVIEDNEFPPLTVKSSKSTISEGETFQLTISTSEVVREPLTVTLTCENPKRFTCPMQATIPAGQKSVTVDVTAKDDDVPSETLSNAFIVSAPRYENGEAIVLLEDDDMPVLELAILPNKVQEGAGPVSVAGILRRTGVTTNKITVRLSDDSNGGLYFGHRELVLQKGVEEVSFNFGPIDNAQVDGDRTYSITAAVWLSSCSCSAAGESAGSVSASLEVLDDDGPALTLTSTMSTIKEGGKTMLTVGRNKLVSIDQPLTVHLNSDYDSNLSYEHTVTIPAGQQSVQVEISSKKNDVSGDTHTVVFTVQADGFASGTCYMMVTDQTLPDAVLTDISVAESEVEAGGTTTVSVTIKNVGVSSLPARTQTNLYLVGSKSFLQTFYTQEPLSPGDSVTLTKPLTLDVSPGQKSLYSAVNERKSVVELNYNNNTSVFCPLLVTSPFTASVTTDKTIYKTDEAIHFSGKIEGNIMEGTEVEVYFTEGNTRQSLSAVIDSRGNFTCDYSPFSKQVGHFTFGACYPGEDVNTVQGAFDIVGLLRTTSDYISCQVIVGTPYQGDIEIKNPSAIEQHNIQIETVEGYDNISVSTEKVASLSAGSNVKLKYTINAIAPTNEQVWQQVKIRIVSDEGAATDVTLFCFCRQANAQLALNIEELNTTVTKGTTREYPVVLTNRGAGNTGKIILSLPKELQSATATELPSLRQGDSLMIVFNLKITDNMQIGVPLTGRIGINCENGNGIALPYSILPVSEDTGILTIDVCDEYTYYTDEKPHIEGAKVVVSRPATGEKMAEGVTDHNGMFSVELKEGYYQIDVTADKHDAWSNYVIVDPGKNNVKVVNLFHEAIRVDWSVTETEVEDEYRIKITETYETNVLAPVVVTELPDSLIIDNMDPGESVFIYATMTNKGLIAAEDVQLIFPNEKYLSFNPLVEMPLRLMPLQSVCIPIRVTLSPDVEIEGEEEPAFSRMSEKKGRKYVLSCYWKVITAYFWKCGDDHKWKKYEKIIHSGLHCIGFWRDEPEIVPDSIPNPCGDGFLWIGGGGGGGQKTTNSSDECTPCLEALYKAATDGLWEALEGIYCVEGTLLCPVRKKLFGGSGNLKQDVLDCEKNGLTCIALSPLTTTLQESCYETGPGVLLCKLGVASLQYLTGLLKSPFKCFRIGIRENARGPKFVTITNEEEFKPVLPSAVVPLMERCYALADEITAFLDFNTEIFGDSIWLESCPIELTELLDTIITSENALVADKLRPLKPENIDNEQFDLFINRINNTFYGTNYPGGKIDEEKLAACAQVVSTEVEKAVNAGFDSAYDWMLDELHRFQKHISPESPSVCAQITLQIDQTLVTTRPAYRGTLTVFNGHDSAAMTDARLNLVARDANGKVATAHEFQINAESLEGFGGEVSLTSGWTLDAQQTGTATVLFIPTKYAAPTEPVKYSFGGSLTYIDPFTGLEVTRDLFPVTLTVNPSPDLELTYLMQRDVYGDDPLTTDKVEPMEPAEFALIINNKGYGEAKNVRMLTEQPKITENEKGLFIDFDIISSQVNGNPATLSLGQTIANDFGTIAARSQSYAQWWLRSTLLGHFTSYEVEANHVTSYGNQDLSLVDTVTIHEMVHGFTPVHSSQSIVHGFRGWLVNDIVDADDMPDVVYFTDATQQPLYLATGTTSRKSDTEYQLSMTSKTSGWNYGSVADPTNGKQKLVKIVRQRDGAEMPVDNVWQTDRTLRDGQEWLYENHLHFVSEMTNGSETYILSFEPKPDVELAVERFIGVPNESTVLKKPLEEVTVRFNKPINSATFTTDDLTLYCQGVKQDATAIAISKQSDTDYRLGIGQLTRQDGYFVLTVQTTDITDTEGFKGSEGRTASWIQYLENVQEQYFYVTVNKAGYATFYDSQWNYMLPSELKASVVSAAANNKLTYTVLAGNVVPKGVAVMLEANPRQAGTYTLTSTEDGAVYNGINLLRGSDDPILISLTSGEQAYKLAYGPSGTEWNEVFCWYWGADDGGPFRIEGHKAWLVLPATMSTRGFSVDGDAFGIEDADPSALIHESPVYDLQGRQVNLRRKKGVYVSRGKKMIVK